MPDIEKEFHTDAIPVVGECTAGRAWKVEPDGVLRGVTYGQPWVTVGNLAHCPYVGLPGGEWAQIPDGWRGSQWQTTFYPHGSGATKRTPHKPGGMGCSCGWWSYHDLSMSAEWVSVVRCHNKPMVSGLIHAYGLMTRGTKGYRSEKATIIALIRPGWADNTTEDDELPSVDLWARVLDKYRVPAYATLGEAIAGVKGRKAA